MHMTRVAVRLSRDDVRTPRNNRGVKTRLNACNRSIKLSFIGKLNVNEKQSYQGDNYHRRSFETLHIFVVTSSWRTLL